VALEKELDEKKVRITELEMPKPAPALSEPSNSSSLSASTF
jgi:hypothetical protein